MRAFSPRVMFLLVFTGFSAIAAADTIVLKNGRRIAGDNVVEEETRVVYETGQGKFSLSKSLVDHVERDGAASEDKSRRQPPAPLPTITVAPSARPAQVVVNNAVNRRYLDDLARQTLPTPQQRELIVVAFLTAVEFEIEHGRLDSALEIARAASSAPAAASDTRLLMGLAIVYLQRQDFRPALEVLVRARQQAPDSAEVWKLLGFVEYSTDRLIDAKESWRNSLSLAKDPDVEKMLERAERESAAEDRFQEAGSNHFAMRFEGGGGPGSVSRNLSREILTTLETHYAALVADFGGSADALPPDPVLVILYTGQAFYDVTRAPSWTGALFDGKIRLPVEGLATVTPQLSAVLKHELTHSFMRARSRARCPAWLNEGIAQMEEGRSVRKIAPQLELGLQNSPVSMASLAEPFSKMPERSAAAAYAISLGAAQMLREKHGMSDIGAILDRLARGASIDAALRDVLGYSIEELDARLLEYLKTK